MLIPNLVEFVYALKQNKEVFVTTVSVSSFVALLYCFLVDSLLLAFMENNFLYLLTLCVLTLFRYGV